MTENYSLIQDVSELRQQLTSRRKEFEKVGGLKALRNSENKENMFQTQRYRSNPVVVADEHTQDQIAIERQKKRQERRDFLERL